METSSSEPKETGNSDQATDLGKVRTLLKTMEGSDKASQAYGDAQTELNVILNRYQLADGLRAVGALVNEALELNRMGVS